MSLKPIEELTERRQRRRLRNHDALLQAARKVFERKGFAETSVTDIIEVADVGRGTFYNYFSSKDEAFDELLDELVDELVEAGTQIGGETSVRARIELAMGSLLRLAHSRRRLLAATEEAIHLGGDFAQRWGQLRHRLEESIARDLDWCRRHDMLDDPDTETLSMIMAGMIESVIFLVTRRGADVDRLTASLCATYWNALFRAHEGADDYILAGDAKPKPVFA